MDHRPAHRPSFGGERYGPWLARVTHRSTCEYEPDEYGWMYEPTEETRWPDQTILDFEKGDCFRACVAGVLRLPLQTVPNFCSVGKDLWWDGFLAWLEPRGLWSVLLDLTLCDPEWVPAGLWILSGKSPRGTTDDHLHSVVMRGREVAHDPHPSRAGVLSRHYAILIVPLDAGRR